MAHAKTNRRKTNERKTNAGFWTFRYENANGDSVDIGGFHTRRQALIDVTMNPSKYPSKFGRIVFVKH